MELQGTDVKVGKVAIKKCHDIDTYDPVAGSLDPGGVTVASLSSGSYALQTTDSHGNFISLRMSQAQMANVLIGISDILPMMGMVDGTPRMECKLALSEEQDGSIAVLSCPDGAVEMEIEDRSGDNTVTVFTSAGITTFSALISRMADNSRAVIREVN